MKTTTGKITNINEVIDYINNEIEELKEYEEYAEHHRPYSEFLEARAELKKMEKARNILLDVHYA